MFGITMPGTGSPDEECPAAIHGVSVYDGPVKDRKSGEKKKRTPSHCGLNIRNGKTETDHSSMAA